MAYRDRLGITAIKKSRMNRLCINIDYDRDPKRTFPVLFFTPHMDNTDVHYHIDLTKKEAATLRAWLDAYLRDPRATSVKRRASVAAAKKTRTKKKMAG